jgi:DNA-directed RNA polymerase subunit RPC12/RpoP
MFCLPLVISSAEWVKILDAANRQFPNEKLSGSEIVRRYALTGVEAIKDASPEDLAKLAHDFQASFQTSVRVGDERQPIWTCPHCGFVHLPADLLRIDSLELRCKRCGKAFTPPSAEQGNSSGIGSHS